MKNALLKHYLQIKMPQELEELLAMDNVILSPHVAGWTIESKEKLAQVIVHKITTAKT